MTWAMIVDDHEMVRRGLRSFLESQPGIDEIVDVADGDSALREARRHGDDDGVVLLDIHMPGRSGLETARALVAGFPHARVILLTGHTDAETIRAGVALGVAGFLMKDASPAEIGAAIATTRSGGMYLHASIAHLLGSPVLREPTAALSERELQVLEHLREGMSNRAIGESLGISEKTARTHVSHILAKLGVESRTQAALLASRWAPRG